MDMDEHLALLERKLEVLKTKTEDLEKLNPEEIRDRYDLYRNMIEDREIYINESQEYINKNKDIIRKEQDSLQKQQELINEINILYDKMKKKLNENRIGTLQGIAGKTINKNNIIPNEGDVIAQNVLDLHQSYNEAEDIERNRNNNIGGKKRKIKNKTHKKRNNKNKKTRRFIRNK